MSKNKNHKNIKRRILNVFIVFCFFAAAYFFYQGIITRIEEKQGSETYGEIEKLYSPGVITDNPEPTEIPAITNSPDPTGNPDPTETPVVTPVETVSPTEIPTPAPTPNDTIPQQPPLDRTDVLPSFYPLLDTNEDIRGYIKMPESTIVYPVVQGVDNDFYLKHTIYGEETIWASIFMDFRNNVDVLDHNTILYGHNLNTTMFNDLDFFVDEETRDEFYAANGVFRFDTVYKYMQWEVYSAYVVDKDDFNYLVTNFDHEYNHKKFLHETMNRSAVDWGIVVDTSDKILTLSTCNHWYSDSRTVVHARLITPEN